MHNTGGAAKSDLNISLTTRSKQLSNLFGPGSIVYDKSDPTRP